MKNDCSRDSFDPGKHFSSVRMQQGRVQVDADWNEACDIITHRVDTEAADVIGPCGGPMHNPAFHIVANLGQLNPEEQELPGNQNVPQGFEPPDFLISAGRYYVDGILCENEQLTSYRTQPDLPAAVPPTDAGLYLVYVDVWQRHLTALDDATIREIALGGPDTATRAKTVWQIKHFLIKGGEGNCATRFPEFEESIAAGTGKLSARTRQEPSSADPCIVPPGGGYTGLENQLYRVEIHDAGEAFDPTGGDAKASDKALGELRLRAGEATFKWSRNNGFVATGIESINVNDSEITVQDLGPDTVLGFKIGQWVEISDDRLELNGLPGQLLQIEDINRAINLITLSSKPTALSPNPGGVDPSLHPKLRGWDGIGAIPTFSNDQFLELESGVQVRFFAGSFKTGDYWNIPARTATADALHGNIEWPTDAAGQPLAQLPFGIKHHYCRLAMLNWDGGEFETPEDCRRLFPPITELTSLYYVSGAGQEAMPNDSMPELLQCSVMNGQWPVAGAHVKFVAQGNGRLAANLAGLPSSVTNSINVTTGADGIASCAWRPEPVLTNPSQLVEARLLDANSDSLPPIVRFNGNLSIASQVFYDPRECAPLSGPLMSVNTVQEAIDQLADLVSLYEGSGNDQEVMPGTPLKPLIVLAANTCGPVEGRRVNFEILEGAGNVNPFGITDADGLATANWLLDSETPRQQLKATLVDEPVRSSTAPTTVTFAANLSIASEVAYTPSAEECPDLTKANVRTVKEALDELCKRKVEEPGIRIERIVATDDAQILRNDTLVPVARLKQGITIVCNGLIAPESVGPSPAPIRFPDATPAKPTCFLTLDLPFPLQDLEFWRTDKIFGYQPLIVAGTVSVNQQAIQWTPTLAAKDWMQKFLFLVLAQNNSTDRVLAHLTLKGNYIWSDDEKNRDVRELYLDADVFGTRSAQGRLDIQLPSGDGRKGGDFEMWFWLFQPFEQATNPVIIAVAVGLGIDGFVRNPAGAAISAVPVTATNVATGKQATEHTDGQGKYTFARLDVGTYGVRVQVDNASAETTVTIHPPSVTT